MRQLTYFVLLVVMTSYSFAQSCNCNVTLSAEGSYDGKALGYVAGQTICIAAGNYKYFYFKNIVGTATQPIKIINCGGQVTVGTETGQNGIQFYDSKFVKLTGSGDSRFRYGINLNKTPANYSGIVVTGFSSDVEIDRVEVSGTGFAGIMIKMDPTCDPATWRRSFAMYNIRVHDSYVHDTYSEGLYIGNSFWNTGMVRNCNGVDQTVYPHNIYGLKIYNNITERTGAEGIQYACAPEARVYNNVVKFAGVSPFALYQNNGIQASGGVSGRLYNNIIQNVPGNGLTILGHSGTNLIYNNLITDVGGAGIFCDNRPNTPAGNPIIFTNNTIVNTGLDGFRLYNELDLTTMTNNVVVQAATGRLVLTAGTRLTQQANNYQNSLSSAVANGVMDNAYKPLTGSPLIDRGMLNSSWAITYDLRGKPRPKGAGMDIGAYEYQLTGGRLGAQTENGQDAIGEDIGLAGVFSFPTPCTNELFVRATTTDSAISEVKVYSMQGAQVLFVTPETPAQEVRLQTGSLPVGEYIYRVLTTDFTYRSGRFIKQ